MPPDSYAESLEEVLKIARSAEIVEKEDVGESTPRDSMLRAAALVAVMSMIGASDERSKIGRELGEAWSQDHRRPRMGKTNLMESRQQRTGWR